VLLADSRSQSAHLLLRQVREERGFSQNHCNIFAFRSAPPLDSTITEKALRRAKFVNVVNHQMDRLNPGSALDITLHGNNLDSCDTYNDTDTPLSWWHS
jgi:hypothetical protein